MQHAGRGHAPHTPQNPVATARSARSARQARSVRRGAALVAAVVPGLLALTACTTPVVSDVSPSPTPSQPAASASPLGGSITVVTHESFALPEGALDRFTAETGVDVTVVQPGDGGALVNQLVLTKDNPLGDVAFGVDSVFAPRALAEGVFAPYTSQVPAATDAAAYAVDASGSLTAIDLGDVCFNVDTAWFAKKDLVPPASFDDLLDPAYKDLAVVTNAATSSPGLSLVLATIGTYGEDGWQDWWRSFLANGAKVADGWSDAYYGDFTAGGGEGDRPVVLSYASSPPYTVPEGGDTPTTAALLDTCFRQVEHAGVLANAKNPVGAQAFIDFLLSDEVQAGIPETMYMYPVSSHVPLPAEWERWAPLATTTHAPAPERLAEARDTWIREWTDLVTG